MHESSIVEGILRIVSDEAARHGAPRISRVNLAVGLLACVEPRTLTACFELLAEGTPAEGAPLDVQLLPLRGVCLACGDVETRKRKFSCPSCGDDAVHWIGGRELYIASIEVPGPDATDLPAAAQTTEG
ncbi:hydrogenase maturation nickel metallochaperone HypA [Nitratidesulfovibrio sp. SRB-5]|uniref:hydrogenase maturation nickel metallochaperone HypA n=1 Tax=Nitratidesulfovibrio sp. SRB-5 TaxID=2872636 RepID=UPI0010267451|nr:hydrogenase maturation nickel metallochaperone HypA [Nitratidesulfovibrio sp. SRB-5]MBZ2171364.1 hydrogenase maturation nickel metallochaperone HypA [Nitratidesulfovibrio sp. SRB-5]RXF77587.1 hydrogenase maturation nickel metallochaperone HypA [Desulfovibrio sp. DS-1]